MQAVKIRCRRPYVTGGQGTRRARFASGEDEGAATLLRDQPRVRRISEAKTDDQEEGPVIGEAEVDVTRAAVLRPDDTCVESRPAFRECRRRPLPDRSGTQCEIDAATRCPRTTPASPIPVVQPGPHPRVHDFRAQLRRRGEVPRGVQIARRTARVKPVDVDVEFSSDPMKTFRTSATADVIEPCAAGYSGWLGVATSGRQPTSSEVPGFRRRTLARARSRRRSRPTDRSP